MAEPATFEQQERNQRLKSLAEHPGWADLQTLFDQRKTEHFLETGERLTSTPLPVNQREIDFQRGRWAGVSEVLGEPAKAIRALRKQLEVLR